MSIFPEDDCSLVALECDCPLLIKMIHYSNFHRYTRTAITMARCGALSYEDVDPIFRRFFVNILKREHVLRIVDVSDFLSICHSNLHHDYDCLKCTF